MGEGLVTPTLADVHRQELPMLVYAHDPGRGRRTNAPLASIGARSHWGDVIDLQRTAGNRAVAGALALAAGAGGSAAFLPFALRSHVVQRDAPPADAPTEQEQTNDDFYEAIERESTGQTDVGANKADASAPAGTPGLLKDAEEADYRTRGESTLSGLGGPLASGYPTTGHTPSGPIAGFPEWFSNLQNKLIGSADWRPDKEEPAQKLLEEYALKRFAVPYGNDPNKVPPTIRVYAHYIGRSTSNQRVAAKWGLPNTAEVGGADGAKMWCAAAGTKSLELALASLGLKLKGGPNWTYNPPVPTIPYPAASVDGLIEAGDQVSYIGGGAPATGGHTTSVVSPSQGEGSVFLHTSGNAGGGTSGSVRLTSSKPRTQPPKSVSFADIATKKPASIGAPDDKVWVYSIVKYSQMWNDLGTIDTKSPDAWTTGPGADFVKKYRLEVAPVRA